MTIAIASFVPEERQAAITASASAAVRTKGFSMKIPFTPDSAAAIAISAWQSMCRMQSETMSGFTSASMARQSRDAVPGAPPSRPSRSTAFASPSADSSATATRVVPSTAVHS